MITAAELYDAAAAASDGRRTRGWAWRRAPVLWLTSETVSIGDWVWISRRPRRDPEGRIVYGYTARQCRQIQEALRPALAAAGELVENQLRKMLS